MFDDISDDEMEVQTEVSDEQLDMKTLELLDYELKKPGPLEVWYCEVNKLLVFELHFMSCNVIREFDYK
jgi:hypothetical protein